jgi:hypothetical protein
MFAFSGTGAPFFRWPRSLGAYLVSCERTRKSAMPDHAQQEAVPAGGTSQGSSVVQRRHQFTSALRANSPEVMAITPPLHGSMMKTTWDSCISYKVRWAKLTSMRDAGCLIDLGSCGGRRHEREAGTPLLNFESRP